jgi:hypothetical protein
MKESRNPPLILHCHIPKTAGTTVSAGLRRSFEILHLHHYHPDPFYILNRENLERLLDINPALRSVSSHHLRSFPLNISGRPTFLMTFLRKPEDAFISQLRHVKYQFSTFPSQVQSLWPKETPRLPLRELARQYLEFVAAGQDFCPQTRFFCNASSMAQFGLSDGNTYGIDSHQIAQSILREFHFVGIVDEMKKSLELLTDALAQRGVRIYFNLNDRQNCSSERGRPNWLTMEDEIGHRVLKASKSDRLLYRHFREVLLASHQKLQDRCWLGFRVAAVNASKALRRDRLPGAARSLAHSGRLFWNRQGPHDSPPYALNLESSDDLLEEHAASALAERAPNWITASDSALENSQQLAI